MPGVKLVIELALSSGAFDLCAVVNSLDRARRNAKEAGLDMPQVRCPAPVRLPMLIHALASPALPCPSLKSPAEHSVALHMPAQPSQALLS